MTIRTRLILAFFLLAAIGFYELVQWNIEDIRPRYFSGMEEAMVDMATLLAAQVETETANENFPVDDLRRVFDAAKKRRFSAKIYEMTKTQINARVYLTDAKGIVLFDSEEGKEEGQDYSRWNNIARTMRGEYGARATRTDPNDPMSAEFHVSSPIYSAGRIIGVLTVCKRAGNVAAFVNTARGEIAVAGAAVAAAVILLGMAVTIWFTRPIAQLTQYAQAVRDGKRPPAPRLGRNEMGKLAAAFEEMRAALEGKQYVEEYVQTLTHQMKSPLSAIRGAAELLNEEMPPEERRRFLANVRDESARLQDLIDRMLQLSAVENRRELQDVVSIPLSETVAEVIAELRPIFGGRHVVMEAPVQPALTVPGERFLIRQAIVCLLQNAVEFTEPGGTITITLNKQGESAVLRILDDGSGVPEYALDKVFNRFYSLRRPATGRTSSGLGLAFVREVAALHGGSATLANRPEGGAEARITLPCR